MIPYVRHQMSVLVPSLQKAKITEREAHALFALMLCETGWNSSFHCQIFSISSRSHVIFRLKCVHELLIFGIGKRVILSPLESIHWCIADVEREVSERLLVLLDAIRAETLQDLQIYYREELGLSDFSIRLGNLLTICHNVRVSFLEMYLVRKCVFAGVQLPLPNLLPHAIDTLRLVVNRRTPANAHPVNMSSELDPNLRTQNDNIISNRSSELVHIVSTIKTYLRRRPSLFAQKLAAWYSIILRFVYNFNCIQRMHSLYL